MNTHPRTQEFEDAEPGELPVEPDQGPVPAGTPNDPKGNDDADPEA